MRTLSPTLFKRLKAHLLVCGAVFIFAASISAQTLNSDSASTASPQSIAPEGWQLEIRPYVWLIGIDGRLRVGNLTADSGRDSSAILGALDFALPIQIEAKKGRWSFMVDENYSNLGASATGPLGFVSIQAEPTLNILEVGGSYTAVALANGNSSTTNPLPPVFSAEILGGARWIHLGLELIPTNAPRVEGSRHAIGAFIGNRFKFTPHKRVTLIGKYTVGGSGVDTNFAWSADGLVDFRLGKRFSLGGGYRALGVNMDDANNRVGFNGNLKGLMLSATFFR